MSCKIMPGIHLQIQNPARFVGPSVFALVSDLLRTLGQNRGSL